MHGFPSSYKLIKDKATWTYIVDEEEGKILTKFVETLFINGTKTDLENYFQKNYISIVGGDFIEEDGSKTFCVINNENNLIFVVHTSNKNEGLLLRIYFNFPNTE